MKLLKSLLFFSIFFLFFTSCKKDVLLTDSSAKLGFSTDTVFFDTVFTTVGSTTKIFKIYNDHSQPLNISKIFLATGKNSQFRINVDGVSGVSHSDVEIAGGDSMFVFVQVTVDPTSSLSPFVINDSVVFETNGNIQDVKLIAVGRNVYLHKPSLPASSPFYSITGFSGRDTTLPNDKPHLFFGYVVVDSACKVTIQPGTQIYMHNKAVFWVYKDGTLNMQGAYGNEITVQGDRLEPEYKEVPGQWGMIWLSQGSKNNVVDWAIIKNGSIGIRVDTVVTPGNPTLKLTNTIIKNMQAAALFAQGGHIWSSNCVFANCGQYVAALTIGGKYKFEHCTFANFWSRSNRTTPLLLLNNYYISSQNFYIIRNLDSAYFGNCILYGDQAEEFGRDSSTFGGIFSYKFDHCILKTSINTSNGTRYTNVYKNLDPGFKDAGINDYQLKTSSVNSIDKGNPLINIPFDLNNTLRTSPPPDLGPYEL